jgi:23S rRNA (cytidine1920-2'-O)/16S rRNA (cytidine1409-2'-O)-methyltransferase
MSRLDLTLLERKLASTRTKAQELIRGGQVKVNGRLATRPGEKVEASDAIELLGQEHPYVSRGGLKLEAALHAFPVRVEGKRILDVGQSTGGFSDCLLRAGASSVVGIEVGQGQLAESLRSDPRVTVLEKQDIRTVDAESIAPLFELAVADLSFISLRLVLPSLPALLSPNAELILLVKPQFEVGPENVGSGGIVRSAAIREAAVAKVEELCALNGFTVAGKIPSPLEGGDGNQEFLLHLRRASKA